MDWLREWFDLSNRPNSVATRSATAVMPLVEQVLVYLATVVGVVFANVVAAAQKGQVSLPAISPAVVAIAFVVSLILMPYVWAKIGGRADANLFVRLGYGAESGVFWTTIVAGVGKALNA